MISFFAHKMLQTAEGNLPLNVSFKMEKGQLLSLYGNSGTGKTTIAHIIANTLKASFFRLSAISSGVKEVREVIEKAKSIPTDIGTGCILFIDEANQITTSTVLPTPTKLTFLKECMGGDDQSKESQNL